MLERQLAPAVAGQDTGPFRLEAGVGDDYTATRDQESEENVVSWKTPKIVEIALGAEINSYVCAKAK